MEGRPVAKSSACLASNVPHTTGLRMLNCLVRAGFISSTHDPADARRWLVQLTPLGSAFVIENLRLELLGLHATV